MMQFTSSEFSADVSMEGYMLFYKGKPIGGASIMGKYKGRRGAEQVREYRITADNEIRALVSGRGQQRFRDAIARIDGGQQ